MHGDSAEASVVRTYLDWLAELPWKKMSKDQLDIVKAKDVLDEDHYGLTKIKDRILEYLSVRKLNPDSKGPILCFAGKCLKNRGNSAPFSKRRLQSYPKTVYNKTLLTETA